MIVNSVKAGIYIAGLATGILLPIVGGKNRFRKAAVKALAAGLEAKDSAVAQLESLKEDAQDIYAEAKERKNSAAKDVEISSKPVDSDGKPTVPATAKE
ncbi:MAG: DUF6110 family protein [Clostridiales Family XIII bacterium]|jgi:hypothetical protein|nr:DUF6110 family protein [Clostridiales Family XIII bacterium]